MTLVLEWRATPRLQLQWQGWDGGESYQAQQASPTAVAAVVGPPGRTEPVPIASLVTDDAVPAGMPLAVNRANGHFVKADASIYARAVVVGLAEQPTAGGLVATAAGPGTFSLADWTAVTGTAALLPGQLYFLMPGGGLSTTAPHTPGQALVVVGEAVSSSTLNLRPSPPILL